MLSKDFIPEVGCPHFRSVVKNVRSESNTLLSGMLDILDNIYGIGKSLDVKGIIADINIDFDTYDKVYRITISDNIPHGFKQIFENGTSNPLNMGHIRDGHNNDKESSEFGTGLKKAIIFISELSDIYTRSISDEQGDKFVKVSFDIPLMIKRQDPSKSYQPSTFDIINSDTFYSHHKYDTGSTIIMQNLNRGSFLHDPETGGCLNSEGFINMLKDKFIKSYSELIYDETINIILNGERIVVPDNVNILNKINDPDKIMNSKFYVKLNYENRVETVCRISSFTKTRRLQFKKYDETKNKFMKMSQDSFNEFKKEQDVFEMEMISITTKGTDYVYVQNHDHTDFVRYGRCYEPSIKITKNEPDGYSNHIYNRVDYISKRLNNAVGVGTNKKITKPSNLLISAIHATQKESTKRFRAIAKGVRIVFDESDDELDDESITSVKSNNTSQIINEKSTSNKKKDKQQRQTQQQQTQQQQTQQIQQTQQQQQTQQIQQTQQKEEQIQQTQQQQIQQTQQQQIQQTQQQQQTQQIQQTQQQTHQTQQTQQTQQQQQTQQIQQKEEQIQQKEEQIQQKEERKEEQIQQKEIQFVYDSDDESITSTPLQKDDVDVELNEKIIKQEEQCVSVMNKHDEIKNKIKENPLQEENKNESKEYIKLTIDILNKLLNDDMTNNINGKELYEFVDNWLKK
jgi:hypothetical protein